MRIIFVIDYNTVIPLCVLDLRFVVCGCSAAQANHPFILHCYYVYRKNKINPLSSTSHHYYYQLQCNHLKSSQQTTERHKYNGFLILDN